MGVGCSILSPLLVSSQETLTCSLPGAPQLLTLASLTRREASSVFDPSHCLWSTYLGCSPLVPVRAKKESQVPKALHGLELSVYCDCPSSMPLWRNQTTDVLWGWHPGRHPAWWQVGGTGEAAVCLYKKQRHRCLVLFLWMIHFLFLTYKNSSNNSHE